MKKYVKKEILEDLYFNQNKSQKEIGKIVDCHRDTIWKMFKEYKITPKSNSERVRKDNTFEQNFFGLINTEEKAYWLGFLYADGYVSSKKDYVRLKLKDLDHIEKFKNSLNYKGKILEDSNIVKGIKRYYPMIALWSKQFKEDLIKLGCIPNKSLILKFPNENQVPFHLLNHFIRGYFDGDGSVSTFYRKNQKNLNLSTNFVGTYDFLKQLQNIFNKNSNNAIFKIVNTNVYSLHFYMNESILLYNFMYNNATIYLDRKKEKFESYFKQKGSTTIISLPNKEEGIV